MCTVTFIPVGDKYFISSNRDEKNSRGQAIPPMIYMENGSRIIYPRDVNAGGTWIALHDNGTAAVLLNGAFEKHDSNPPYKKSRGIIFLEIINANNPVRHFMHVGLEGIEPFTMIIMDNCLYECRWDGLTRHCRQLKKHRHHIWSSATLYSQDIVKKREQWFASFLNRNPMPSQDDILKFHQFGGSGDIENDLKMNRDGALCTVSITSIVLDDQNNQMKYVDLKDGRTYSNAMPMRIPLTYAENYKEANYA